MDAIRPRRMLLVVDNCEHLHAASRLVESLSRRCPKITVVATSRERLGVGGEHALEEGFRAATERWAQRSGGPAPP